MSLDLLKSALSKLNALQLIESHGEITVVIDESLLLKTIYTLKHDDELDFSQCVDICGVDYLKYRNDYTGPRYAVVYHMLSLSHNWRLRVRTFIQNTDLPAIESIVHIYSSANWYEREIYDLYGIIFKNHPDLRRILTDYDFIGHPGRKDFPISGYTEVKYDDMQKRVIYQNVTIEPREITPRIVRQ